MVPTKTKLLSVVILNWNGEAFLRKFLPTVVKFSQHPDFEVVVADNGSTDGSVQYITNALPEVRIIQFTENYGFAGGYNKALEHIDAEFTILLNSDVEVTENWIQPLLDAMIAEPALGAVMPKLLQFDNKSTFEYAGAAGGYIDKYGYPFCRGRVFDDTEVDVGQYNDNAYVFWATGACLCIRTAVYKKAGGLDSRFFAHMEEIDLCWRLQWMGYKIKYCSSAVVYHVGGGALSKENPKKTYLNFRNNLFMLYKNLDSESLYKVLFIRLLLDGMAAIKFVLAFKFKFFHAIFKAHLNFYKNISYLRAYRKVAYFLQTPTNETPKLATFSIVYRYFIKKQKTYNELIKKY